MMMKGSKGGYFTLAVLIFVFTVYCPLQVRAEENTMEITIEDAVKIGLQNSIQLKQVENQIQLSEVSQKRTKYLKKKMDDGEEELKEGKEEISNLETIYGVGVSPVTIVLPDGYKINPGPLSEEAKARLEAVIDAGKQQISQGEQRLDQSLIEAGSEIGDKLDFDSLDALGKEATGDLMTTMANVQYEVSKASYDIYKNQIAMLIQKSYYDVLKSQKMLEVKKKAMERAQKQYEFAKDSWEAGMKAKDDMLLAQIYYKGTQIEYRKAQGEWRHALIELKKNMNIPLDTDIVLTDVLADKMEEVNLEEDLKNGLKNRLEMKKVIGEVTVYDLNFQSVKKKYPENTFQYKEAKLLQEKAWLNLVKTKNDVEASILQSYETLMSTGDMLTLSQEMVEQAKESVEIAEYKYKEGFGADTSLLKKLDLESAAGTIVEVLAAEENLAQVEEKVVEIMYGYNLAKMKYYNDTGRFIY